MDRAQAQTQSQVWLTAGPGVLPLPLIAPSSLGAEKECHLKSQVLWKDGEPWVCPGDSGLGCNLQSPHQAGPVTLHKEHFLGSTGWPLANRSVPLGQPALAPGTKRPSEGRWPAWHLHVSLAAKVSWSVGGRKAGPYAEVTGVGSMKAGRVCCGHQCQRQEGGARVLRSRPS